MSSNGIPITGWAALNALGSTRTALIDALRSGRRGLVPAPSDLGLPFSTFVGPVAEALAPMPGGLEAYDTRLARMLVQLLTQLEAPLARARERWRPERIGIFLGTSTAGADSTERAFVNYLNEGALPSDYDFERQHTFGASLEVVRRLSGATGPSWVASTACTSSAKAFASARRMIRLGLIDAAIVGGVDTLCRMTLTGFNALGAMSHDLCRPFGRDPSGINIGEGGALLLLEREGEAFAELEGVGESSDAYHFSAPHPEGLGAKLAFQRALGDIPPSRVDHINAHGTGTPHNDQGEARAIREVFGAEVPVISTKGYTGHTLGGAGATEAALALLMMEEGFIAPSVGAETTDPDYGIDVVDAVRETPLNRVLSASLAFGGNNIVLALRRLA